MKKGTIIVVSAVVLLLAAVLVIVMMQNQNVSAPAADSSQSSDSTSQSTSPTTETTTNEVVIQNSSFSPAKIVVKKGTTVTWTNQDSMGHNVIASDSASTGGLPLNAPLLNKGQTFSHTFNEVGNFPYNCAPHPSMRGSVEVIE